MSFDLTAFECLITQPNLKTNDLLSRIKYIVKNSRLYKQFMREQCFVTQASQHKSVNFNKSLNSFKFASEDYNIKSGCSLKFKKVYPKESFTNSKAFHFKQDSAFDTSYNTTAIDERCDISKLRKLRNFKYSADFTKLRLGGNDCQIPKLNCNVHKFRNPCLLLSSILEINEAYTCREYLSSEFTKLFNFGNFISNELYNLQTCALENFDESLSFTLNLQSPPQKLGTGAMPNQKLKFTLKSIELKIIGRQGILQSIYIPFRLIPIFYSKTESDFFMLISQLLSKDTVNPDKFVLDWKYLILIINLFYSRKSCENKFQNQLYNSYCIDIFDDARRYKLVIELPKVLIEPSQDESIPSESYREEKSPNKKIVKFLDSNLILYLLNKNFLNWDFEILNYLASNKIVRFQIINMYTRFKKVNYASSLNRITLQDHYENARVKITRPSAFNLAHIIELPGDESAANADENAVLAECNSYKKMKEFSPHDLFYFFIVISNGRGIFHKISSFSVLIEEKGNIKHQIKQLFFSIHNMKDIIKVKNHYNQLEEFISKIIKLSPSGAPEIDKTYFLMNKIKNSEYLPENMKIGHSNFNLTVPFLTTGNTQFKVRAVVEPMVTRTIVAEGEMKIENSKIDKTILTNLLSTAYGEWNQVIIKCYNFFKSAVKTNQSSSNLIVTSKDSHKRRKNMITIDQSAISSVIKLNRANSKNNSQNSMIALSSISREVIKRKSQYLKQMDLEASSERKC